VTGVPANRPMLSGNKVNRIHWVLGTDRLRAVCHCTAEREFEDPIELWDWLLGHPHMPDTVHSGPNPEPDRVPVAASR
jgi:hypothetical protein